MSTGIVGPSVTRADSAVAEHAWTPSPDIANQVRAGYTRRAFQRLLADSGPSYDVVGYQSLGPSANANADFATSVTQVTDTFTWVRGGLPGSSERTSGARPTT